MNFLETVEKVKEIVEAIDKKDEEVITTMEKLAPESCKIAVELVKKYEPKIVIVLLSAIAIAEAITGKPLPSEKLSKASENAEGLNDAPSLISQTVNFINSVIKKV